MMADFFMPSFTDQIHEVEREIAMRVRVYPRMVSDKKMSQDKADRQLASMRAVLATLEGLKK